MRPEARSGIGMLAGAAYAAALLVFGVPGLSGATTVNVSTEAEYRGALATLSGDNSGPHTINVTADITINDGTTPTYNGTQALTIEGNGHTLDATGTSAVLNHSTESDLTIDSLTVTGGDAAGGGGGGIFATGPMTITNSTISGNSANLGGGIRNLRGVTVTNSTISGNSAEGDDGGGILTDASVTITNSTITGNSAADDGGGIRAASATLTHVTMVENSAPDDGANLFVSSGLTSFGSVVALPQGGGANCIVTGGTTSQGYNYSDDASCGFTGTGDTQGGPDPDLGPLASNGGPTQTRMPQPASPLIDTIPEDDCHEGVTDDQRDVTRPQDGDEDGTLACDIGAVEVIPGENEPGAGPARPVEGAPSFTG